MGKYDDFVAGLARAGVPPDSIDDFVKKYSKNYIKKGLTDTGLIKPKLLENIKEFLGEGGAISFNKLNANNKIITQRALVTVINSGEYSKAFDSNGKLIFDVDSLGQTGIARAFGKSTDDISTMANDVNVKNAANTKRSDLINLGISGSLVSGVVFLMLLTGKMNPVEAIEESLKMAADAAGDVAGAAVDAGGDIFTKMFSGVSGFFNVSASFILTLIAGIVLWTVVSFVLKR